MEINFPQRIQVELINQKWRGTCAIYNKKKCFAFDNFRCKADVRSIENIDTITKVGLSGALIALNQNAALES